MNESEQLMAIAELEGWKRIWDLSGRGWVISRPDGSVDYCDPDPNAEFEIHRLPPYLTSRDAIVPVIEKQTWTTRILVLENLLNRNCSREITPEEAVKVLLKTPAQLTKALLLATGKWKD